MKFGVLIVSCLLMSLCGGEESLVQVKERKRSRLLEIENSYAKARDEKEKSRYAYEKSIALIEVQRLKEGCLSFLEAIHPSEAPTACEESWDANMRSVLPLYLTAQSAEEEEQLEKELVKRTHSLDASHPLFILVGCLEGNKGLFSSLFSHAYMPIHTNPDSYLAWKVRGVLYGKIFEASSSLEERIFYKNKAMECFLSAYAQLPEDMKLAEKILFFTQGLEQEERCYARKIFKSCMRRPLKGGWISKAAMQQVIREFMDLKMYDEVQEMIVLYDSFFGYSRMILDIQTELSHLEKDTTICELKKEKS